ncbi:unnamed protein product [Scytosiphon promiscuus]
MKRLQLLEVVIFLCRSLHVSAYTFVAPLATSTSPTRGSEFEFENYAASGSGTRPPRRPRGRRRSLRMDDEIARKGIKEELTTRDEYLATRFTKLSVSQHDLTPFTPSETREAASHLSRRKRAVLLGNAGADGEGGRHADSDRDTDENSEEKSRGWRDHREKGLYACAVGGLPLFTSGWKLEPRPGDDCPSFAEPCDEEHLLQEQGSPDNGGETSVLCARSRVCVGTVVADPASPSGKRYIILNEALEFHPLGKPLPVRCQPENYWGSEGQYRAWVLG